MPESIVYFTDLRSKVGYNLLDKTRKLFGVSGFADHIEEGDKVAVKLHFGEAGNTAFLPPMYARVIVDEVKKAGGKPFVTDTNTLYKGSRGNAIDHLETAMANGFSYATLGAPLVIGDGLIGLDYITEKINGKRFKEVKIASAVYHADVIITLAHFTAHELFGFGGVIKSIGMGGAAPSGKQELHSDVLPVIDSEKCTSCGRCVRWCPADSINWKEGEPAQIIETICIGCGECTVVCTDGAIEVNWKTDIPALLEKTSEYTYGVLKNKAGKHLSFNFLFDMSPDCDCYDFNDPPFVADVGIMVSTDPVAVDQAAIDMANRAQGLAGSKLEELEAKDKFRSVTGIDWEPLLAHGEEIGLGRREYVLEEVE